MEKNIQELTDKMFHDGVEKGNQEAKRIVDAANAQSAEIVDKAKKEAEQILASAQKSANELLDNTKSELKLFAGQSVNALKSEIATMLTDKIVAETAKSLVADQEVMNQFIVTLASKWSSDEPIIISTKESELLKKYFSTKAKDLLDKGVTIQTVNGQKALFSISPANGSYKVNFGEEEFINFFKSFLRPQLVEMLF